MRKLKAFGLALVAVFAISAVASSAASAAGAFVSAGPGNAISGTQIGEHVFTTTHGTVKCSTATFTGTTKAAESTEQDLTPAYTGCKFAGLKAEVTSKSCFYRFTAGNTIEENANKISATVDLKCNTAGDAITVEIVGSKCVVTVPPQEIKNGLVLENSGTTASMDILATINIQGIDYNVDEPTACPNPSDITSHTEEKLASYVGEATIPAVGGVTVK